MWLALQQVLNGTFLFNDGESKQLLAQKLHLPEGSLAALGELEARCAEAYCSVKVVEDTTFAAGL